MNKLTMDEAIKLVDDLYELSGLNDDDLHQNLYLEAIELVRGAGADYKYLNQALMQIINKAKEEKEREEKFSRDIPLCACKKVVEYEPGIINKILQEMAAKDTTPIKDGVNYEMLKMYTGYYGDSYSLEEIAARYYCTPQEVSRNIYEAINTMICDGDFSVLVQLCE